MRGVVALVCVAAVCVVASAEDGVAPKRIHLVRATAEGEAGAVRAAGKAAATPVLKWHGGPMMTTLTVQPIFAGTTWGGSATMQTRMTNLVRFYQYSGAAQSGLTTLVSQEYLNNVPVSVAVQPQYLTNTAASSANLNSDAWPVQTICAMRKATGATPAPVGQMYYAIYTDTATNNQWCAYHSTGKCPGDSAAFKFGLHGAPQNGCGSSTNTPGVSNADNSLIVTSSHELIETITDPDCSSGWFTDGAQSEEIADLCNGKAQTLQMGPYNFAVQLEWSNKAKSCVSAPNQPGTGPAPTASPGSPTSSPGSLTPPPSRSTRAPTPLPTMKARPTKRPTPQPTESYSSSEYSSSSEDRCAPYTNKRECVKAKCKWSQGACSSGN
jgi:hypothetical protein